MERGEEHQRGQNEKNEKAVFTRKTAIIIGNTTKK
jgi:hypothetical protein